MNNFETIISDLSTSVTELQQSANQKGCNFDIFSQALLSCGVAFTAISIYTLPKWVSLISLGVISVFVLYHKSRRHKFMVKKLAYIAFGLNSLNNAISSVSNTSDNDEVMDTTIAAQLAQITALNETIAAQKSQIIALNDTILSRENEIHSLKETDPSQRVEITSHMDDKNPYTGYTWLLVTTLQKLDITAPDYGEACAKYMRKEISKALSKCGLQIIDYSKETEDCYESETAPTITHIDYVSRAIVTKCKDTNSKPVVILKGQVYLPPMS